MEEQFNVYLPSNASDSFDLFPNNTQDHYTTRLNEELYVDAEQYEVGLTEIHYPHNFKHEPVKFTREFELEELIYLQRYNYNNPKKPTAYQTLLATYPGKTYPTIQALVDAINAEIKEIVKRIEDFKIPDYDKEQRPLLKVDPKTNLFIAYNYLNASTGKYIRLYFTRIIANTFGFLDSDFPAEVGERKSSVKASFIRNTTDIYSQDYLFIYSDIGKPVIVGEKKVPLLRIINIEGRLGETIVSKFDNIQYVPVSRSHIRTIEIQIKNEFGDDVIFGKIGTVIVVLTFRKKKRWTN